MKKLLTNILIILGLSLAAFAQGRDAATQLWEPATLLKPTLKVRCARDLNYWKQPNLKNFWSWLPSVQFAVSGPIEDGSYFTYEFFTPDGKPWFSVDSEPFAVAEGEYRGFESEAARSWTDKRPTIATGVFGFKITLKNSLQNTAKPFYQGKFTVKKEFAGTPHPDFKNQYLFYVDQDWMLPLAYLNVDPRFDQDAPPLRASMWFRGDFNGKLKGFLFYNGKQVTNTDTGGVEQTNYVLSEGDSDSKFRWTRWTFKFYGARYFDNNGDKSSLHIIKNKPGNYEVKVLLDGELARTVAFIVGKDGKITDNGVAAKNGLTGFGVVVPANVLPVKEGAVDLMAYKTEAFYGNLLTGF